jgi:arsenite methyltransferase
MADKRSFAAASTGLCHSDPAYLDSHFRAAQPEYEAMLRAAGIRAGWHVLDAGCGGGSFLPLLAELVGEVGKISAIDLAPENIAAIEARLAARPLPCPVEAKTGTVLALPYADQTFDAVWTSSVVQYLTDAELWTALSELRRVVRPGGLVAIKDGDISFWHFSPVDPELLFRSLSAIRPHFAQVHGSLRTAGLYRWLSRLGLSGVRQASTLVERFAPLSPVEQEFIGAMFTTMGMAVIVAGMPEADLAVWRALDDLTDPGHPMKQADFYFREGHTLAVGWVPEEAPRPRQ